MTKVKPKLKYMPISIQASVFVQTLNRDSVPRNRDSTLDSRAKSTNAAYPCLISTVPVLPSICHPLCPKLRTTTKLVISSQFTRCKVRTYSYYPPTLSEFIPRSDCYVISDYRTSNSDIIVIYTLEVRFP